MTARRIAAGLTAGLLGSPGAAQPNAKAPTPALSIEVEHAASAESCPGSDWFESRVRALDVKDPTGAFLVSFTHDDRLWRAWIRRAAETTAPATSERVLEDPSPDCKPLAQAVALTIALLTEQAKTQTHVEAPNAAQPPAQKKPRRPKQPPMEAPGSPMQLWVGASGGIVGAVIAPRAPAFGGSLDLAWPGLHAGLRFAGLIEQDFRLAPGSVSVQAWLASLTACFDWGTNRVALAFCGAADGGWLHGSAEGYSTSTPGTRPYAAGGVELAPRVALGPHWRARLAGAALVPLSQESFSVTGRGTAYVPPILNWRTLLLVEFRAF